MKIVINITSIILFILIAHVDLHAVSYGSNTAVALEPFVQFPQTDTNNQMLGFGWFSSGFGLEGANTTCTFNDFFSASGPIFLNGGSIYLQEDLNFSANSQIWTGGIIDAQAHAISFQATSSFRLPLCYGNNTFWPLTTPLLIDGSGILAVDWSYNDSYGLFQAEHDYSYVYLFAGNQWIYQMYGGQGSCACLSAAWHPSQYYFAMGCQNLGYVYVYSFNPLTETITTTTSMNTGCSVPTVAWSSTGSYLLIDRVNAPYLAIYTFNNGNTSLLTTAAGYPPANNYFRSLSWNSNSTYFVAASTTVNNGLTVYSFNGSTINQAISVPTSIAPTCVDWSSTNSYIAVGFNTTSSLLQIYQFIPPSTLNNVYSYSVPSGSVTALKWSSDGMHLAVSYNQGSSNYLGMFSFNSSLQTLTQLAYIVPMHAIQSLSWSHSGCYLLCGDSAGYVETYATCVQNGLTFNNAATQFFDDIYLNAPLIFQGTSILDGHNYALHLGTAGGITIASGASLLLKNLTIYNVAGTNINCLDNTGTLSFYNVTWSQDSDATFTQGQLAIIGDLIMAGSSAFIYQSDQVSTIYDLGNWYFDNGMTFSYAPLHGETNLISFQDNQSILYLNGTNLYAPSTGLTFTNGCLKIEGQSQFINTATNQANGIWIGDGNSADDVRLKILPESGIITGSGYVVYQNVN